MLPLYSALLGLPWLLQLARGELKMIGATTLEEYRIIEKDEAFTRRMQPVMVDEPDVDSATAILRGLKRRYEAHHGVTLTDAALVLAVKLAKRYLPARKLPDSAIDLVDESCAQLRVQLDSKPEAIDRLERRRLQLQIEATALESEKDALSAARRERVAEELASVEERLRGLEHQFKAEKGRVSAITDAKKRLDDLARQLEVAQQELDLEKAARLQYGDIPAAQKALAELERGAAAAGAATGGAGAAVPALESGGKPAHEGAGKTADTATAAGATAKSADKDGEVVRLLTDTVGPEQIAAVVARWTGIPVTKLTAGEKDKLLHLRDRLKARVVGQDAAVDAVSDAILRSRAGLGAPGRPSSFLLLGGTGTGKVRHCHHDVPCHLWCQIISKATAT